MHINHLKKSLTLVKSSDLTNIPVITYNSWGLWLGLRNIMLISLFIHWLSLRMALKAPIYFKRNRRTNWYDNILNKIRPKRSLFWVRFGSSKQLTKANFLGKFVLAPKHLWATIGPWQSVGVFWNWIFFFLIQQRSGRRTTSPSH